MKRLACLALFLLAVLRAQPPSAGATVTGSMLDRATNRPIEYATVTLKPKETGVVRHSGATDAKGAFALEQVPPGDYELSYGLLGSEELQTVAVSVAPGRLTVDLGRLTLGGSAAVKLERVEVKAKQATFLNTIDRKVYHVGKEIQSATGTAGDLLQNVPSVQVDVEGNVSLRGSENVLILINGRTTALMGRSRAEVLQQLPADAIEKIEVITNPSAKYKPDGTAGIINLALKRHRDPGHAGTVSVNVGNERRFNASLSGNLNPGPYNLSGSASIRQDDRERTATEHRRIVDPASGAGTTLQRSSTERARPFSRIVRGGLEVPVGERDKWGASGSYVHRAQTKRLLEYVVTRDARGAIATDAERTRYDPESEEELEFAMTFEHRFPREDHELKLELTTSKSRDREANDFANRFRVPLRPAAFDRTRIKADTRLTEAIAEYVRPLGDESKLEAGYTMTDERLDADFLGEWLDPVAGTWTRDAAKTNRFRHDSTIHAFHLTYAHSWDKLGVLAGLRPELADTTSHLVTTGARIPNDTARIYPSLHLSYKLSARHELQANYSHRVRRPDADELNPFPEFADPFDVHAGNPRLRPEDTHSFEAGYAFHADDFNLTSTVYHRARYHGFTYVTRDIGNAVFFTTQENLGESRSSGLELTATGELGKRVSLNFSSNTFFNVIDASNLGFTSRKSDVSWSGKLGLSVRATKELMAQVNAVYYSTRLTPQGARAPTGVVNLGVRRSFRQNKFSAVATVSDLFATLRDATRLDTPLLQQDVVRRRAARIVYVGVVYNLGNSPKKKEEEMKFEEPL